MRLLLALALLACVAGLASAYYEDPYTGAPWPCAVHDEDGIDIMLYDFYDEPFTVCTKPCTMPGWAYDWDCPPPNNPPEEIGAIPACSLVMDGNWYCVLICDLFDEDSTCPTNQTCHDANGFYGVCAWPWICPLPYCAWPPQN